MGSFALLTLTSLIVSFGTTFHVVYHVSNVHFSITLRAKRLPIIRGMVLHVSRHVEVFWLKIVSCFFVEKMFLGFLYCIFFSDASTTMSIYWEPHSVVVEV